MKNLFVLTLALLSCFILPAVAQTAGNTPVSVSVPPVIQYSSVATDESGTPLTGTVSITFSLYNSATGGEALWTETQNVQLGVAGQYSVYLGLTQANGLPANLFTSGQAQWLGVKVGDQPQQPRVYLVSVPYAMKARDAATVGGLPPSAFVLAAPIAGSVSGDGASAQPTTSSATDPLPAGSLDVTTTGGTVNTLPLFTSSTNIQSSALTQTGTGATARVGINTTTPAATLDVKGTADLRGTTTVLGTLGLPSKGTATATSGFDSQAQTFAASVFNGSTGTAVPQTFELQAEPTGNDTASASGSLNLLYGSGTVKPAETGLSIASNGQITFAAGQTFPGTGTGDGTITAVSAGSGLSGGGSNGSVTLNNTGILSMTAGTGVSITSGQSPTLSVNTSQVPLLAASNTFTGNQTTNGTLTATGVVSGSGFQIGSILFDYGSYANNNAFLGFGGNATMSGEYNTAVGETALSADTTGFNNTAVGAQALEGGTTGSGDTAVGEGALWETTTGAYDTAIGNGSLLSNTTGSLNVGVGMLTGHTADNSTITGSNNTFLGSQIQMSTGSLSNATAVGAWADVAESNALVLGSISGVNSATASVNVGIGTTTPAATLEIDGDTQEDVFIKAPESGIGAGLDFFTTGSGGMQWEILNTGATSGQGANKLNIRNVNTSHDIFTIEAGGNIGIGTTSPDDLLSVNGSADKTGGGSWGTFSDRRLKDLDGNFNSGLDQILKLNPILYRYKQENAMGIRDHDEHVGLVAQDVQKVIPEAVTENSKGYLLLNNDPIIWAMLNAIKQQQQQIRTQQKQIAAQRAFATTQQKHIAAQERQIGRQQQIEAAQQHEIAGLSRKVTTLEDNLRVASVQTAPVLASRLRKDAVTPHR